MPRALPPLFLALVLLLVTSSPFVHAHSSRSLLQTGNVYGAACGGSAGSCDSSLALACTGSGSKTCRCNTGQGALLNNVTDNTCLCLAGKGWNLQTCATCATNTTYNDGTSLTCKSCSGNLVANAGHTACVCPAGQGLNSATGLCAACPDGSYNDGSQTTCTKCTPPSVVNAAHSACGASSTTCSGVNDYLLTQPDATIQCKSCTGGGGMTANGDRTGCKCPAGTGASSTSTACLACTGGSANDGTALTCLACQAGTIPDDLHASCVACPLGQYSTTGTSTCLSCADLNLQVDSTGACIPPPPVTPPPPVQWGECSNSGPIHCFLCTTFQGTMCLLCKPGYSLTTSNTCEGITGSSAPASDTSSSYVRVQATFGNLDYLQLTTDAIYRKNFESRFLTELYLQSVSFGYAPLGSSVSYATPTISGRRRLFQTTTVATAVIFYRDRSEASKIRTLFSPGSLELVLTPRLGDTYGSIDVTSVDSTLGSASKKSSVSAAGVGIGVGIGVPAAAAVMVGAALVTRSRRRRRNNGGAGGSNKEVDAKGAPRPSKGDAFDSIAAPAPVVTPRSLPGKPGTAPPAFPPSWPQPQPLQQQQQQQQQQPWQPPPTVSMQSRQMPPMGGIAAAPGGAMPPPPRVMPGRGPLPNQNQKSWYQAQQDDSDEEDDSEEEDSDEETDEETESEEEEPPRRGPPPGMMRPPQLSPGRQPPPPLPRTLGMAQSNSQQRMTPSPMRGMPPQAASMMARSPMPHPQGPRPMMMPPTGGPAQGGQPRGGPTPLTPRALAAAAAARSGNAAYNNPMFMSNASPRYGGAPRRPVSESEEETEEDDDESEEESEDEPPRRPMPQMQMQRPMQGRTPVRR